MNSAADIRDNPRSVLLKRCIAFVVDYAFVLLVLQIIGTLAFAVTGGRVQADGPLKISSCRWPPTNPFSFPYGRPFVETNGRRFKQSVCVLGLPGLPHARVLAVTASKKSGIWTINQTDRIALDQQNRAVWILWLGVFAVPLLWLYRSVMEHQFGRTLGKRWLGLRVFSTSEPLSLTWMQSSQRNLWLLAPLFVVDLVWEGPMLGLPNLILLTPMASWLILTLIVLCVAWCLWTMIEASGRNGSLHDRRAGTKVVRIV